MSFIAEFEFVSPLLRESLKSVPEMVLYTEDIHLFQRGEPRHVFWAAGGDFDAFESALTTDPTVANFTRLTRLSGRRLYRVSYTNRENRQIMYSEASKLDIVYLDVSASCEGTHIRARLPDRTALKKYREVCEERGISFRLDRIYREGQIDDDGGSWYGVTEPQRIALVTALERGYFAVPRETTLKEIAADLDISTQALSTRLRRGQTNLVRNVLDAE